MENLSQTSNSLRSILKNLEAAREVMESDESEYSRIVRASYRSAKVVDGVSVSPPPSPSEFDSHDIMVDSARRLKDWATLASRVSYTIKDLKAAFEVVERTYIAAIGTGHKVTIPVEEFDSPVAALNYAYNRFVEEINQTDEPLARIIREDAEKSRVEMPPEIALGNYSSFFGIHATGFIQNGRAVVISPFRPATLNEPLTDLGGIAHSLKIKYDAESLRGEDREHILHSLTQFRREIKNFRNRIPFGTPEWPMKKVMATPFEERDSILGGLQGIRYCLEEVVKHEHSLLEPHHKGKELPKKSGTELERNSAKSRGGKTPGKTTLGAIEFMKQLRERKKPKEEIISKVTDEFSIERKRALRLWRERIECGPEPSNGTE